MNQQRLEQLLNFLKDDPNDPFLLYAIATEYGEDNPKEALKYYDKLLSEHPSYFATYYHAAALLAEEEEIEKAREVYLKGIEVCKDIGEVKALQEIQNAYQNFLFEYDE
ncbi:tetratricopeptide repeat protein [Chondrinema litorale]|uniref:tetratricopeptide repeat protein n=1 Tax=Chondrinema litorale TaxID=2994555 RepID=UPI00254310CF|nr:tetratricopeptide repeat protein [Chondrinema litorale]UZR93968.1 tetratricopeptide repeat protein [Chondrinema litorale]